MKSGLTILNIEEINAKNGKQRVIPTLNLERKAMIIYTSGTTNINQKGVITSHENVEAQITALVRSWHVE